MGHTADEIRRLQGCINDLISVLALPAMWGGQESTQIVSTLLDVLIGMLRLDFAYARLTGPSDEAPIEMIRMAQSRNPSASSHELGKALTDWLAHDRSSRTTTSPGRSRPIAFTRSTLPYP